MGEVIFTFHKLWQLRQLSKSQSRITLVVLPQQKAISPSPGGSKRYSLACAFMHVYQSGGFCAGKGKAVMGKKEQKGEEKRGAAAELCCSLPFTKLAYFLRSLCKTNSTAEKKKIV